MPIGTALALGLGGAAIGGIAGAQGKQTSQSSTSGINLNNASDLQNYLSGTAGTAAGTTADPAKLQALQAKASMPGIYGIAGQQELANYQASLSNTPATAAQPGAIQANYGDLTNYVNAGAGLSDVNNSTQSSRDLASMLQQYQNGGYQPSQDDITNSNKIAGQLFGAQQEQLNQSFYDQQQNANRQAALMGRSGNDPILQAKLAQEQTRQQRVLDASQGSFAQQYALQQPMQRLQFAQDRTNVLGGLASQAMSNRQALLSMGSNLLGNERNYQVGTSQRYGNADSQSGGGFGGAISGALGGAGTGFGLANSFSGFNSFGSSGSLGGGLTMPQMSPYSGAAPSGPSLGNYRF